MDFLQLFYFFGFLGFYGFFGGFSGVFWSENQPIIYVFLYFSRILPFITATAPDKSTHKHQEILQHGDQIQLVIFDNDIEYALDADPLKLANSAIPNLLLIYQIEITMTMKTMLTSLHKLRYLRHMMMYKFFGGRVGEKLPNFVNIVDRLLDGKLRPLMKPVTPLKY